jgi:hypothetical protein
MNTRLSRNRRFFEHNPIVMTQHRGRFYVGTFGDDGGPSELAVFKIGSSGYTLPFKSRNPIVGLAWRRERLYAVAWGWQRAAHRVAA